MWTELLVLCVTLLAVAAVVYGSREAKIGPLSHLPGPVWALPLIGDMPAFVQDPYKYMFTRYQTYGPVFRAPLFGQQIVVVGDEGLLKGPLSSATDATSTVPVKTFSKIVDLYNMGDPARHKIFRKNLALALTPANIKARLQLFMGIISKHLQDMQRATTEFTLDDKLRRMVVDLALGPIAGFEFDDATMGRIIDMAQVVQGGLFAPPIYFPGTDWYKAITMRPAYLELLRQAVRNRFKVDEATGEVDVPDRVAVAADGSMDTTALLLQEFAEAKDTPTLDKLAERLIQNVLGASETTFGLLLALCCLIIMTPGLQERLREEQRQVMAKHGDELSYDVLASCMPLLDATVRETLRFAPSSHGVFRNVHTDMDVGGHRLPKGSLVMVSFDILHCLDPKAFEGEPSRQPRGVLPPHADVNRPLQGFKPERWLDKDPADTPHLHAFAFGPHSCLGMNLAMLEAKMTSASMLRAGTWELLNTKPRLIFFPWTRLADGPARVRLTPGPL